jgi:hypothetical protein
MRDPVRHRWVRGFQVASVRTVVIRHLGDRVWPTEQLWSMVRTHHDESDEDPADYESEGRVFESPWAHPDKTFGFVGTRPIRFSSLACVPAFGNHFGNHQLAPSVLVVGGSEIAQLEPRPVRAACEAHIRMAELLVEPRELRPVQDVQRRERVAEAAQIEAWCPVGIEELLLWDVRGSSYIR